MNYNKISNPKRGCGTLQKGGYYLRSELSPWGKLSAWSWLLGECYMGGINLALSPPARGMTIINLPATVHYRRIVTENLDFEVWHPAIANLPKVALLDHVGSKHYNPYTFWHETRSHGVSRRVDEYTASVIKDNLPIPIVFTHEQIPMYTDTAQRNDLMLVSNPQRFDYSDDSKHFVPTWFNNDYGLLSRGYTGSDHYMPYTLAEYFIDGQKPPKNLQFVEQTFGVSWITECAYVKRDDDDDRKLEEIASSDIRVVEID